MGIERVIIKNYRALRSVDIRLNSSLNVIVGDNETGKSTLLEAINLALKCQLNRRPASYELHPFLFNLDTITEFVTNHKNGISCPPPEVMIELYLNDDLKYSDLVGTINSKKKNCAGICLKILLDTENFSEDYESYIKDPERLTTIPIEFYQIEWCGFDGHPIKHRRNILKSTFIDPSAITSSYSANKYVLEIARENLNSKQKADLALTYRSLRDVFTNDSSVREINEHLSQKTGVVSDKTLTMSMDMTAKGSWEAHITPHLDGIPMPLTGKGEQNSVKIKLAIEGADNCQIILMEEPENHLSHTKLNQLINHVASKSQDKQLIASTHSSFVLNKLGPDNVLMFNGKSAISISDLPDSTKRYFMKLPGHDTLRMILSAKTILVEGPSDELIVQKSFLLKHKCMPLEKGTEVISVNSLAFKRFLDIAKSLQLETTVITDNDGNIEAIQKKYEDYTDIQNINICYSNDENCQTLEPQLLKANGLTGLNELFGTEYQDDGSLLDFMISNKTDVALKIFDSDKSFIVPRYIQDAI